jgi:hypothetical protein
MFNWLTRQKILLNINGVSFYREVEFHENGNVTSSFSLGEIQLFMGGKTSDNVVTWTPLTNKTQKFHDTGKF